MIISPSSLDTNLSQLLDEVNTGKTQLPEFQRDWTWDDGRICGIIASLSQGYPMGAIMRLQYGNPEIKFKYRTIKGVGELNVVPDFLVLDGQQRLTSIYQSMFSQQPVSTKTEKGKKEGESASPEGQPNTVSQDREGKTATENTGRCTQHTQLS